MTTPDRFGTFDLETDPFKRLRIPKAFAACYFDGKTLNVFWGDDCCAQVMELMIREKRIIYAHNGGKFDFHFILHLLLQYYDSDEIKLTCIGTRIVKIKTPSVEFRDSFAVLPRRLADLGNKKEIDIQKLESTVRHIHKAEIIEYLKQDCIALFDAMAHWIGEYGLKMTLAGTTFDVLQKRFGIKPPKSSYHHDKAFRPFYFAGRVEFWKLGYVGDGYSICDINSAFPWAMQFPHWFQPDCECIGKPPKENREQCFYVVTCDSNGALPLRSKEGGVEFPIGKRIDFFATGWELFAGIELGLIRNVDYRAVYVPKVCQDFAQYVRHFYEMKRTAKNESERNHSKLLLNSLYGRFALNPRAFKEVKVMPYDSVLPAPWKHSFDDEEKGLSFWQKHTHLMLRNDFQNLDYDKIISDHLKTLQRRKVKRIPAKDWEDTDERPAHFVNVCTAASITGCVRAFLLRSKQACKGVVYCDTDSLVARDTSSLEFGDGLGQWKLEKSNQRFWIGGKKLYASLGKDGKWKTASKGVRLTPEQIVEVAEGKPQTYEFEAPSFSVYSKPHFVRRTVRRDDQRKKRNKESNV